ncbi:MAG: hypothetical protein JW811_03485 [Clostridiales bacterium]|nr:hypothetical protein [Clostridiales bacterium]
MRNPLPVREIRKILGDQGFLRLYGQDTFVYISDVPRRTSADIIISMRQSLRKHGFTTQVDASQLLLIDLQPSRWKALLNTFQKAKTAPFPRDETLHPVYALARLLELHPSDCTRQPTDMIRAVFKQYAVKGGLPKLAPRLHARCAEKLRRGEPLPSVLAKVLYVWLAEN